MISARIGRVSQNVIYNILASTITFGVNIALLPYIVTHIGKEIYGIFTIVMVITGYLALFDFGLTGAIVKYVAELSAQQEYDEARNIITASVTFLLIIGVVAAIILISAGFWFDTIFKVSESNKIVVRELLWVAGLASFLIWPGKAFDAALQGFQCYGWIAINSVFSAILIGVCALLVFSNGYSIVHYMIGYYLINIIKYYVSYVVVSRRVNRKPVFRLWLSRDTLKKMMGFGSFLFYGALTNIIILQFDNIVIGYFLSVAAVTIYTVVYYMQNLFRVANSLLNGPLFPFYAEMHGQGRAAEEKVLLLRGTKIMSLIFVTMVVITIIYARPLILVWMGAGFEESILPAQILISFWIVNGTLEVGTGMLTAKGFVRVPFFINLINAICNIGLSLLLVKPLGIVGVVLGTTVPMILFSFPCLLYQVNKVVGTSFRDYFSYALSRNIILYIYCALLAVVVQRLFYPPNLLAVALEMALIYFLTLATGYLCFFSGKEREDLKGLLRSILGRKQAECMKSGAIG